MITTYLTASVVVLLMHTCKHSYNHGFLGFLKPYYIHIHCHVTAALFVHTWPCATEHHHVYLLPVH